jgi:hypothetical protein
MIGFRHLAALSVAAAGLATAVAVPAPAHAQGIIRSLMSDIGMLPPAQKPIDYRERAPLVIPKSLDLPKPEAPNAATAGAAWPKDPDQARLKAAEKKVQPGETNWSEPVQVGQWRIAVPLSPTELRRERVATQEITHPEGESATESTYSNHRLTPAELKRGAKKADVTASIAEPPRHSLTDPPPGYRVPAADAPWAAGKDINTTKQQTYREAADEVMREYSSPH